MFTLEHWSEEDYRRFSEHLKSLADKNYLAFNSRVVPESEREMWGVRVPKLRQLAKEIARGNWREFLAVSRGESVEQVTVEGVVVSLAKAPFEEKEPYRLAFAHKITNWAICDIAAGHTGDNAHFAEVAAYTESDRPFVVRYGLVRLLADYVDEAHIDAVLDVALNTRMEHYYVTMARAWLLSVCYVKFPEQTSRILPLLDEDTRKKTNQKIRDSYRVPKQAKENLEKL